MSSETTLYEILGGQPVIEAVVDALYKRILEDPSTLHYFAKIEMTKLKAHQAEFIGQALGGPATYSGRSMSEAHAGLHLKKSDFDAVAGHLVATLEEFGVPQVHIDTVISNIAAFEREIIHREHR